LWWLLSEQAFARRQVVCASVYLMRCPCLYNTTSYLDEVKFITEDIKAKDTNITTIYRDNKNGKVTKVTKMPS
jgi:hypothetical protein